MEDPTLSWMFETSSVFGNPSAFNNSSNYYTDNQSTTSSNSSSSGMLLSPLSDSPGTPLESQENVFFPFAADPTSSHSLIPGWVHESTEDLLPGDKIPIFNGLDSQLPVETGFIAPLDFSVKSTAPGFSSFALDGGASLMSASNPTVGFVPANKYEPIINSAREHEVEESSPLQTGSEADEHSLEDEGDLDGSDDGSNKKKVAGRKQSESRMPLPELYARMGLGHDHEEARIREQRILNILQDQGFQLAHKTWIRDTKEHERNKIISEIYTQTYKDYGFDRELIEIIVRRGSYYLMQGRLRRIRRNSRRMELRRERLEASR